MAIKEFVKSKKGLNVKEINLHFSDLNDAYETTRQAIIEGDKESHKIAAASYFLATLTAFASLLLLLIKG